MLLCQIIACFLLSKIITTVIIILPFFAFQNEAYITLLCAKDMYWFILVEFAFYKSYITPCNLLALAFLHWTSIYSTDEGHVLLSKLLLFLLWLFWKFCFTFFFFCFPSFSPLVYYKKGCYEYFCNCARKLKGIYFES